ncbi:transposable element Tcb1 transposase [Trichonephila clavipes]|nr:transposable element Tcb1 transposase [Trichonephila clavipes]
MSSCRSLRGGESLAGWKLGGQLGRPRQTSRREDHHIVRNASVQPTASMATIQVQVAPSHPVSSRTIRRPLAEGHLGSRRPLRVLPLTPTYRRLHLEWCRARGNLTAAEWIQVVFSDESRFNLSCDDNHVHVWRHRGECLNSAFALQRHTAPTAVVYVHDYLQSHVLPPMQRLPGAIFKQDNARPHTARVSQDCLRTVTTLPCPRFVSNRAYVRSFGMVSWASHEFERTRGKVTANMERDVSRHHTELVYLNTRSYRTVHSR